jgi:hypothetical protein
VTVLFPATINESLEIGKCANSFTQGRTMYQNPMMQAAARRPQPVFRHQSGNLLTGGYAPPEGPPMQSPPVNGYAPPEQGPLPQPNYNTGVMPPGMARPPGQWGFGDANHLASFAPPAAPPHFPGRHDFGGRAMTPWGDSLPWWMAPR